METSGKPSPGLEPGLDPAVRAFRVLLTTGQRLHTLMDERLRADGLTTQQAALLTVVKAMDGPSVTGAARALGTTHQNAAQIVTALTRKGFLRTEPDPADRRRRVLVATEAADAYWRDRDPSDFAALDTWFSALSPAELTMLTSLAERLLRALPGPRPT
ncbi:DNA-binding MarR family transcriptional regulator [Actinocorallia herbida]|uniref:DNA-binding MarR family transcriptional regulator n=1 Tax=Actinocorallia herbida TaxID=58109 RepID=A0A3N1D1G5_9ACTN|nr:MarR family winged helix-turn-helix transcriptional regulator [Actinocorallia herbida]ROO87369.1 DNA-binding MarR family transcriptional regulator [Actinocorallia herbida]